MKNKMKQIIIFMILATTISCKGQNPTKTEFTYENFENEILKYEPIKRENVSEKDYQNGLFKLNDTKSAVKNNPKYLNSADYWNITMAFLRLKEPKSNVEIAFKKAISFEDNDICTYIDAMNPHLEEIIPEIFNEFYKKCSQKSIIELKLDLKDYSLNNKLDYNLILLIDKINTNDNQYRKDKGKYYEDPNKLKSQKRLDIKNQHLIDSLYNKYKFYIGKTLVGKEFEVVMWSVIQHSNPEMMERYLPVVHKAVKDKELDVVSLKMLIDRFYGLKYGYQIFGSQSGFGFKLADEKKRKEIKLQYGIE